ncbi:hypothetical protein ZWY2020_033658 [Hordeum vulgare]|nr:hypothetical protein ZWY2020_033658 [Hordeum vulgare]
MHFDGSKMRTGLGPGIVLTSPKGDQLKYALQIHFAASNNVAEYEALAHGLRLAKEIGIRWLICFGDSDLVVQQVSGEWDARDANMASYRFLNQQLSGPFEGCEFHHIPRAENEADATLAKIGSTRQAIPAGVSLEQLHKPSPESASIFVPAHSTVQAPSAPSAAPAAVPTPVALTTPTPIAAPAESTIQVSSAPPTTLAAIPMPALLAPPNPMAAPAKTTTPDLPGLESCRLDTQWVDVMEVDGEPAAAAAPETPCVEPTTAAPSSLGAAEAPNSQDEAEATLVSAPSWAQTILSFLLRGELPQNEAEARQIQRRSAAYAIINRELVRRGVIGMFQRCVKSKKGQEILRDIHQGECGHHATSRTLVAKAFPPRILLAHGSRGGCGSGRQVRRLPIL